jgi:hypothetical protein
MTCTINGKEWTKADINKRCAELMGIDCHKSEGGAHAMIKDLSTPNLRWVRFVEYDPCGNPLNTDAIIDKCWDELMKPINPNDISRWENLKDGCGGSKLVAACICYIECNEDAL